MRILILAALLLSMKVGTAPAADTFRPYSAETVPQTVEELWGGLDLESEPLDVETVKEWTEEGITTRLIRFTACTVKGKASRIAAFYVFPEGGEGLPAFVWAHGGGQRAEKKRGIYFARHGYASIDVNWGGREMVQGVALNTDWGSVDPSQGPQFYPGALRPRVKLDLKPDEHTIDSVPSARNGNWFLLAYAARRAITFLAQQPEVDPERLGFTGFSMGGNITSYASIDPRLKAVIPMVGGTGFLTVGDPGVPGSATRAHFENADLFGRTVDSAAFWPLVKCPVLFLGATNDFHGIFDRSFRCAQLVPHGQVHVSNLLHFNHSLGAANWILVNRFFDHHLKGTGPPLPAAAASALTLDSASLATFLVTPSEIDSLESVEILYSHDPRPRTRFWKTAAATRSGDTWTAELPVRDHLPLHAFAQCTYRLGETVEAFEGSTGVFNLASRLQTHQPKEIKLDLLTAVAKPNPVFHDFTRDGLNGWGGPLSRGGPRTYKFQDPERAVPAPGDRLVFTFDELPENAAFRLILTKNAFLGNGKPKQTFVFGASLTPESRELVVAASDLKLQGGEETMSGWEEIVDCSIGILRIENGRHVDVTREWAGSNLQSMTWREAE